MTTRTLGATGHVGSWRQARAAVWWIAICSASPAALTAAHAQIIPVRTAPLADGGQFLFLPSANLGMGGLSVALADSTTAIYAGLALGVGSLLVTAYELTLRHLDRRDQRRWDFLSRS